MDHLGRRLFKVVDFIKVDHQRRNKVPSYQKVLKDKVPKYPMPVVKLNLDDELYWRLEELRVKKRIRTLSQMIRDILEQWVQGSDVHIEQKDKGTESYEEIVPKGPSDHATKKQIELIMELAKEIAKDEDKDLYEILDVIHKETGIDVTKKDLSKKDADKVIKTLKEWKSKS